MRLLLGAGSAVPPSELASLTERVPDFQSYLRRSLELSAHPDCQAGIFSAAVADYAPQVPIEGKVQSGLDQLTINLVPTTKVIDEVRRAAPHIKMVTFKYQEGVSPDELMNIASSRLKHYEGVFANRGEERGSQGEQVGWLCTHGRAPVRMIGKPEIAQGIADFLELILSTSGHIDSNT